MADISVAQLRRGFIYLLRFPNGKGYIGQTRKAVEVRFHGHAATADAGKVKNVLYAAWRKYGAPVVSTIGEYPIDELNLQEAQFIVSYNTLSPAGYNLASGGGVPFSVHPDTLKKMSIAQTGKRHTENTLAKLVAAFNTAEHRAKVSAVHKGKILTAETRARVSYGLRGKRLSGETCAKISMAVATAIALRGSPWNKGRSHSAEQRAKISARLKGVPRSAEICAKISATKRLRGFKNPFKGMSRPAEVGAKISATKRAKRLAALERQFTQQGQR